jgi:hypothetical protein
LNQGQLPYLFSFVTILPNQVVTPINLNASTLATPETLGSEFDHHRRTLVEKAAYEQHSGWAAELRRYLNDIPDNISKDSNIIQWWSVSRSFISN